jgi:hypothetical protein
MILYRMDKWKFWSELFASNKKLIVAIVEIIGGLITRESYLLLKNPDTSRFRMFLARAIITFFLCLVLNTYLVDVTPKYHFAILGVFAICCVPVLEWFLNSFLPGFLKSFKSAAIKYLLTVIQNVKKEEEDK